MSLSKIKKLIVTMIASITGISGVSVSSSIIAYDALFMRTKRPDYTITAGLGDYKKLKSILPREEFFFYSEGVKLKGYYYKAENSKGLVVFAHGFKSGADNYLPITLYLVQNGYSVFNYDCTGTFDSEGRSMVGMCQQLIDLDNALKYVKRTPKFSSQPLFLMGHSWGGYAASSVLSLHKNALGVALFAPMYNANTIMMDKAEEYVGKLSQNVGPIFSAYQDLLFKDYTSYYSVKGINSVDIPVLIAHGENDKTITLNGQSIYAHRKEITNPNVQFVIGTGYQGSHVGIMHSNEAMQYQEEVKKALKDLQKKKGDKLTYEEKQAFYSTVDNFKYSQVNTELLDKIINMFDSALQSPKMLLSD